MKTVWVTGEDGTSYGHFYVKPEDSQGNKIVKTGDRVEEGQPIGTVQDRAKWDTTNTVTNHIHFEMRQGGQTIDPTPTFQGWGGKMK